MTFSVRIRAVSCVVALLAGYGSVRAGSGECGEPVANRPWPAFPFAIDDCSGGEPVASHPWRIARSRTGGFSEGCSATGDTLFERCIRTDNCPADCVPPLWQATADALLLWRSPARSQAVLFAPAVSRPDVILLDMSEMEFGVQSGPRLGLTRHLVNHLFVEVAYFGIDGWSSSAERDGNPLALFPPGILVSNHFKVDYGSDLHSAELNLRHRCRGKLDLLAGARWVQVNEYFHVVGPNPLPTSPVRYDTLVRNSMYGFQIGANDSFFDCGGPFRVDGFIKAGIYGNSGNQETSTVGNLGTQAAVTAGGDHVSMLGEAGFTALYTIGDHLTVRGGYQAMWIEGVALAPDQISHTDVISTPATATLDADGGLFYHGCHVGLEAHW